MSDNQFVKWLSWIVGIALGIWLGINGNLFGIPIHIVFIILLLPTFLLILFFEIVLKIYLLYVLRPVKYESTNPSEWEDLEYDREQFDRYTIELSELGFLELMDYKETSGEPGFVRLFSHPEQFCIATVVVAKNTPVYCTISSGLENSWVVAVTTLSSKSDLAATIYSFLRIPKELYRLDYKATDLMFQSLLKWREEVKTKLNLQIREDVDPKTYFEEMKKGRKKMRISLLRKSIYLTILKKEKYAKNPQSEWLGDYAKFTAKR